MNERDPNKTIISVRLFPAEAERYWKVMDAAKARNPYIAKSAVMRELFGVQQPNALTRDEIAYFRTGKEIPKTKR